MIILVMLLHLTGPDNQQIEVNVDEIVSLRVPRVPDHFDSHVRCVVYTTDGKFVGVMETCPSISKTIGERK